MGREDNRGRAGCPENGVSGEGAQTKAPRGHSLRPLRATAPGFSVSGVSLDRAAIPNQHALGSLVQSGRLAAPAGLLGRSGSVRRAAGQHGRTRVRERGGRAPKDRGGSLDRHAPVLPDRGSGLGQQRLPRLVGAVKDIEAVLPARSRRTNPPSPTPPARNAVARGRVVPLRATVLGFSVLGGGLDRAGILLQRYLVRLRPRSVGPAVNASAAQGHRQPRTRALRAALRG